MAFLTNGIEYSEKSPESPDEGWSVSASRTRRTFVINGDAANRFTFARSMLGYATLKRETIDSGAGPVLRYYISRNLPDFLPYLNQAGKAFLWAQVVTRTTPVGKSWMETGALRDLASYTKVFMEFEYRTTTYEIKQDSTVFAASGPLFDIPTGYGYPDEGQALASAPAAGPGVAAFTASRYVTRRFRPGVRFYELSAGMLRFVDVDATKRVGTARGIPFAEPWLDCLYTWHGIPAGAYPMKAVEKTLQKVNDNYFDSFYPGTLLFQSAHPEPAVSPFGDRILDVTYGFKYFPGLNRAGVPLGHNAIPRTVSNFLDYVKVSDDGTSTGRPMYLSGDFSALFRPDQS